MLTYLIISLIASIAWLVKDLIQAQGKLIVIEQNWKRYVGCLVAGLLYGLLSGLSFFRWIATMGVIYLVGSSFSVILVFLNWFLSKIGVKKIQP